MPDSVDPIAPSLLVEVAEACRQLGGISTSTLQRLERNPECPIKILKVGSRAMVERAALAEFIARAAAAAKAAKVPTDPAKRAAAVDRRGRS